MGFIEKEIEGNFPNWIHKSFLFCYFFLNQYSRDAVYSCSLLCWNTGKIVIEDRIGIVCDRLIFQTLFCPFFSSKITSHNVIRMRFEDFSIFTNLVQILWVQICLLMSLIRHVFKTSNWMNLIPAEFQISQLTHLDDFSEW